MKFLYCITNTVNGKSYIGVSKHPQKRFKQHFELDKGSLLVYRASQKYGKENLECRVLCEGEDNFIFGLESREIKRRHTLAPNGYNLSSGGRGGATGVFPTAVVREKLSKARKGKKHTKEARQNMRAAQLGKKHSIETRKKISKVQKGKKISAEHKKNIGLANADGKNYFAKRVLAANKEYNSIKEAAIALGITSATLYSKFHRYKKSGFPAGWGYLHLATHKSNKQQSGGGNPGARKIKVKGKEYGSIKEAASAIGIGYSAMLHRLCKYRKNNSWPAGWADLAESKQKNHIALVGCNHPNAKRVLVEGKEYNCMQNAADALGLKRPTLIARFCKYKKNNNFPDGWAYL